LPDAAKCHPHHHPRHARLSRRIRADAAVGRREDRRDARCSAFFDTDLERRIAGRAIDTLVLAGINAAVSLREMTAQDGRQDRARPAGHAVAASIAAG